MRRSVASAWLAAAMLTASFATAHAQDRVRVGVLECRGGASVRSEERRVGKEC